LFGLGLIGVVVVWGGLGVWVGVGGWWWGWCCFCVIYFCWWWRWFWLYGVGRVSAPALWACGGVAVQRLRVFLIFLT